MTVCGKSTGVPELLEAVNISKSFSGIRVLNGVSFSLRAGEVHALVGENGAGKSTFMKVLAGVHVPDSGDLRLRGQVVRFRNAHDALRAGIAMIYQELLPFLDLSVAENIFMGQEPATNGFGWINKTAARREAEHLLERLGVRLDVSCVLRGLPVAEMQVVEIAKALAHKAEVIIMDEPTSALSAREADALFRIIRDLKQQGTAIIYISHKLEEIFRLADRVTVLRDGSHVATLEINQLSPDRLISLMVGREMPPARTRGVAEKGDIALSVSGLSKSGRFKEVSFQVRRGEVLGLGGLMGAGRTDVVNAIFGLAPPDAGEIQVQGRTVRIRHPGDAIRAGIGLVSEDRKRFGFIPGFGVGRNLTLAALRRLCRHGFINQRHERGLAEERMRALAIKAAAPEQPVERLSGGNQQKVVLGRTLFTEPDILLLDEPTRGIDIAAKAEVHRQVRELAGAGKAVVLVSSEIPELMSLSDRILVMRQGVISTELNPAQTTPEEILKFAMPA